LRDCLRDDLLPAARPDDQVGIRFAPGGPEGYRAAVRRHTTTELSPEEIHQIGLDVLAGLRAEWAELGRRALGTSDVGSILARLRDRLSYEYEALAFHESTPGHHLQIAAAQTLTGLPANRRFLDAEVCGYVEGWGLYCERLADEMGLYTSDLQRLGMLSFDA